MGCLYANVIIFQPIHEIDSAPARINLTATLHSRTAKETRFLDAVPCRLCNPIIPPKAIHHPTLLTLNPRRLSTTQVSSASRPTVTVTLGMGSAKRGYDISETRIYKRYFTQIQIHHRISHTQ